MGMFDELVCHLEGFNQAEVFQTKDTPTQQLDRYRICADGTLWIENYDIEDRSDHNAVGFTRFVGLITRINKRWERLDRFTGEIYFYGDSGRYSAYYINGELQSLVIVTT